jgi:hypothetical protein
MGENRVTLQAVENWRQICMLFIKELRQPEKTAGYFPSSYASKGCPLAIGVSSSPAEADAADISGQVTLGRYLERGNYMKIILCIITLTGTVLLNRAPSGRRSSSTCRTV